MPGCFTKIFILFVLLNPGIGPVWAATEHYVTTGDARIYERPDEHSHIVFDVPRFRKIVVEPLDRDWVKLVSVGTREIGWCLAPGAGNFIDGRYSAPLYQECGEDETYPQGGFLPTRFLGNFPARRPPLPEGGYVAPEQFWHEWGIVDDRKLVTNLDQHPFNAIVRIMKQGKERPPLFGPFQWTGDESGLSGCSGAFVYSRSIVLTAKHCVNKPAEPITVRIERGRDRYEDIQARVIEHGMRDTGEGYGDWAVLRLEREPRLPVEPLNFSERLNLGSIISYHGLMVGYPADMFAPSRDALGFFAPTATFCRESLLDYTIDKNEINIQAPCDSWPGNSGGPLLVWQAALQKFGILGVASEGINHSLNHLNVYNNSAQQKERLLSKVRLFFDQSVREGDTDKWGDDHRTAIIPGISKLFYADHAYGNTRFAVGKDLIMVARAAAGLPPLDAAYWNDRRYLGLFYTQSVEPVGVPGSLRHTDFTQSVVGFIINDVSEIRKICVVQCSEAQLDPHSQKSWTYRDTVDQATIKYLIKSKQAALLAVSAELPDFKQSNFLASLIPTDKPSALHLVTGGDLFIIRREELSVIGVQRGVMNFRREGQSFNENFSQRYAIRDPATGTRRELNDRDGIGEDFGIGGTATLRSNDLGQPTPSTIAVGTIIGTKDLRDRLRSKTPPLLIAAMDDPYIIPGAVRLGYAGIGGAFDDAAQTKLITGLHELTRGDKNLEIIVYCHHARCWLSHNAMLRIAQAGYKNLRWFRGGIEAWIEAGLALDQVR